MVVLSKENTNTTTIIKKMLSPPYSTGITSPSSIDEMSVLDTFFDHSDKQLTQAPSYNCEVTHLRLDNNLLADLSNFSLPDFSLLTVLDLSYNKLTELPTVFAKLINLKELFISHNQISLLTDTLCNLVQLEILDISYNQLLGIDDKIYKLINLHHLDLRNNQLESLPYSLGVLESRLFTLLIDNNPYSQAFLDLASPLLTSDYSNPINKDMSNSKTGTNRWRKFRSAMRKSISLDPNSSSSLQSVFRNMTGKASEESLDPGFTNLTLDENKETRRTKKYSSHSVAQIPTNSYQLSENDVNGKANNTSSPQVPTKNPRRYVRSTASALDNGVMERQAFDNRRCQTLDGFVFISDNSNFDTSSQHSSDFEHDANGVRTPQLKKLGYSQLGDQSPGHTTSPSMPKVVHPLPELPSTGERSPMRPSIATHSKQNSQDSTTAFSPLPPKPNQAPMSPLDKPLPPTGDLLRDSGYSTDTPNKLNTGISALGHKKKLSNHINDQHPELPPLPTLPQASIPRPSVDDKRDEWQSDGLALPPPPLPLPPSPYSPTAARSNLISPPPPIKSSPLTPSSVNPSHSNGVEHWPSISVGAHLLPSHSALVDFLRQLRDRWDLSPASSETKEVQQRRRNGHGYILKQNLSEEAETELLPKEGDPENINKRRKNILNEILHTEETYVKSLSALVEIYKRGSAEKGIFTPDETKIIFGNVEPILQFHSQALLPEIRKTMQLPEPLMGTVFEKHSAYLKMYSQYVNDFDVANVEVERLMALGATTSSASNLVSSISSMGGIGGSITSRLGKRKIKLFLEQCRQHPDHNQLNLQGFLLLPVQRIPRYRLLLQDLLKYTPLDHPDRPALTKGYIAIALRAEEINERKRVKESNDKVVEIQNRIKGNSVTLVEPHRRFIKEGVLHLRQVVSIRHRTLQSGTPMVTTPPAAFASTGFMSSPPLIPSSSHSIGPNEQATTLKALDVNHDLLYFLFNDIMIQCKIVGKEIELHRVLELGSKLKPARLVNAQILRVVDNRSIYYFMGKTEELVSWANAINSR